MNHRAPWLDLSPGDDMARLIAKRAQRILAETGIEAPLPD